MATVMACSITSVSEQAQTCILTHVRLQIIELAAGGVPWKEHLYELEKQEGIEGAVKFCLYEVPP